MSLYSQEAPSWGFLFVQKRTPSQDEQSEARGLKPKVNLGDQMVAESHIGLHYIIYGENKCVTSVSSFYVVFCFYYQSHHPYLHIFEFQNTTLYLHDTHIAVEALSLVTTP